MRICLVNMMIKATRISKSHWNKFRFGFVNSGVRDVPDVDVLYNEAIILAEAI